MFTSMSCAFIPYSIEKHRGRNNDVESSQVSVKRLASTGKTIPWYMFFIPAFCDLMGSGLTMLAYTIAGSAVLVQVAAGTIMIWTCLLSSLILHRRFWSHHYIGIALCFVSLCIVCVAD